MVLAIENVKKVICFILIKEISYARQKYTKT